MARLTNTLYLVKEMPRFVGWQPTTRDYVVKQLATGNILHDHENVGRGVNDLISGRKGNKTGIEIRQSKLQSVMCHRFNLQSDNMRMCAHFEDIDFATNFLRHFQVFDFPLVQDLHSYFKSSNYMMSNCRHTTTQIELLNRTHARSV